MRGEILTRVGPTLGRHDLGALLFDEQEGLTGRGWEMAGPTS